MKDKATRTPATEEANYLVSRYCYLKTNGPIQQEALWYHTTSQQKALSLPLACPSTHVLLLQAHSWLQDCASPPEIQVPRQCVCLYPVHSTRALPSPVHCSAKHTKVGRLLRTSRVHTRALGGVMPKGCPEWRVVRMDRTKWLSQGVVFVNPHKAHTPTQAEPQAGPEALGLPCLFSPPPMPWPTMEMPSSGLLLLQLWDR